MQQTIGFPNVLFMADSKQNDSIPGYSCVKLTVSTQLQRPWGFLYREMETECNCNQLVSGGPFLPVENLVDE